MLFGLENLEQRTWSALWRGRAALELGDLGAAKGDLRAAANLNPSHLAAALLLGECHRRAGDEAMSSSCFCEVFRALADIPEPRYLDEQWGNTISHAEAVAWSGWGVVTSPVKPEITPRSTIIREALRAARRIPHRRQAAHWTALCLDAEARLSGRRNLARALAAVEEADALLASPEIILHLLELYEAQAKTLANPEQRLEVIRQAERAVRKLKRLDRAGEVTYAADAGQIMARLEALRLELDGNGHGRRRSRGRIATPSP
jgi:tetratricopeptide (TPR) repeat protein